MADTPGPNSNGRYFAAGFFGFLGVAVAWFLLSLVIVVVLAFTGGLATLAGRLSGQPAVPYTGSTYVPPYDPAGASSYTPLPSTGSQRDYSGYCANVLAAARRTNPNLAAFTLMPGAVFDPDPGCVLAHGSAMRHLMFRVTCSRPADAACSAFVRVGP